MLSCQSCPALCDPMDCSLPDSSVPGILQVRILEWVPMSSSGDLPNPGIKPRTVPGKPGQVVLLVCKIVMSYQKQGLSSPKMFGMLYRLFPMSSSGDLPNPGIKPRTVPGKPGQVVLLVCKIVMSYQKQGLSSPKMFGMLYRLFPICPSMTMYQKFTGNEAEL